MNPKHNRIQFIDSQQKKNLLDFYPTVPNKVFTQTKWLPDDGCTYVTVSDRGYDALLGEAYLKVEYGNKVWFNGKGIPGKLYIYQEWFGTGSLCVKKKPSAWSEALAIL